MEQDNTNFKAYFERIMFLLKKLREKESVSSNPNIDDNFLKTLDMILANYDMIKNSIPDNVPSMAVPGMEQMMAMMVKQLESEFDIKFDDLELELQKELGSKEQSNKNEKDVKIDTEEEIKLIDEMLSRDVSPDHINELLDRRLQLQEELKKKQQ